MRLRLKILYNVALSLFLSLPSIWSQPTFLKITKKKRNYKFMSSNNERYTWTYCTEWSFFSLKLQLAMIKHLMNGSFVIYSLINIWFHLDQCEVRGMLCSSICKINILISDVSVIVYLLSFNNRIMFVQLRVFPRFGLVVAYHLITFSLNIRVVVFRLYCAGRM